MSTVRPVRQGAGKCHVATTPERVCNMMGAVPSNWEDVGRLARGTLEKSLKAKFAVVCGQRLPQNPAAAFANVSPICDIEASMFNLEQNCTSMNYSQDDIWENPRFRNWIAVGRACQLVQQTLARELRPLDIKPPQLDILINLLRTEGLSQQDLARKLLVGRSNMTMLLPQLEKRGLIERRANASDKRALRLFLTDSGRSLAREAMAIQAAIIDEIMSLSTPEECDIVGDSMRRIVDRLLKGGGGLPSTVT